MSHPVNAFVSGARASAVLALVLASAVSTIHGQALPTVAIVAADSPANTGDPQTKLLGTGLFAAVDVIDARTVTPTLAALQAYDAVLVWTNSDFADEVTMGNNMADYVDAGGGVVVTVFGMTSIDPDRRLAGRWLTDGYEIIPSAGGATTGNGFTLGTVHLPAHPLMAGVTSFHGGNLSYRPTTTALAPGAIRVADWSDGKTLIVVHGTKANRVDLGMFPPSNTIGTSNWQATTDGALIMGNALRFTGGLEVGVPYCFGDGSGTPCPCLPVPLVGDADKGCPNSFNAGGGKLAASGVASIGNDTLVMTCTTINNGGAVVFQGTTDNGGGLGTAFGDGLRCAAGTVRRMRSHTVTTNTHQYPDPMFGDNAISIRGAVLAPGDRLYQGWYRSGLAHCEPTQNYNLTNGLKVTWVP